MGKIKKHAPIIIVMIVMLGAVFSVVLLMDEAEQPEISGNGRSYDEHSVQEPESFIEAPESVADASRVAAEETDILRAETEEISYTEMSVEEVWDAFDEWVAVIMSESSPSNQEDLRAQLEERGHASLWNNVDLEKELIFVTDTNLIAGNLLRTQRGSDTLEIRFLNFASTEAASKTLYVFAFAASGWHEIVRRIEIVDDEPVVITGLSDMRLYYIEARGFKAYAPEILLIRGNHWSDDPIVNYYTMDSQSTC